MSKNECIPFRHMHEELLVPFLRGVGPDADGRFHADMLKFTDEELEETHDYIQMKKLYLDVDGVVLTKRGEPALHLVEFLRFVTEHFDCYWLTSHCQGGASRVIDDLTGLVPDEALPYLAMFKPTSWKCWKTEAIDYSSDFVWLDDYAFDGERAMLKEHGVSDKLVLVNLAANPDRLRDFAIS